MRAVVRPLLYFLLYGVNAWSVASLFRPQADCFGSGRVPIAPAEPGSLLQIREQVSYRQRCR